MGHLFWGFQKNSRYLGLALVLLLYLALAGAYSWLVPLEEGPDEIAHFDYLHFIVTHGHLPTTLAERAEAGYKSDLPPLYPLLAAIPGRWAGADGPPDLKRFDNSVRHRLLKHQRDILNIEEERLWPGQGAYLVWHLGRWVSILFGAGVIWLTWLTAYYFFPEEPGLALGAAAFVGFIPRFTLSGAMLNYETLQALLTALFLWLLLKLAGAIYEEPPEISSRRQSGLAVALGMVMGLAFITKYSTLLLPLGAGAGLWLAGRHRPKTWQSLSWRLSLIAVTSLLVAGWWLGFVVWHFNEVDDLGWGPGLLKPLLGTDTSDTTSTLLTAWLTGNEPEALASAPPGVRESPLRWLYFFYHSFWVVDTGGNGLPLPLMLLVAGGLIIGVGIGLGRWWRRSWGKERLQLAILLLYAGLFLPLPLFRFLITGNVADTSQGRHWLFPAASALAILFVGGVREITPAGRRRWVGPALGLWLLAWNLFQLWGATWGYEPPLPVWTSPQAVAQAQQPLEIKFAEGLKLAGYNPPVSLQGFGLRLDLFWQAAALMPVDYLTEVSLIDREGAIASQWLGHPLQGRYPTRAWNPGDTVRDTVQLPLLGVTPGIYSLRLRLITPQGKPVEPEDGIVLAEIELTSPLNPLAIAEGETGTSALTIPINPLAMGETSPGSSAGEQGASDILKIIGKTLISPLPPDPAPLFTVSPTGLIWWHPDSLKPYDYRETIVFLAPPALDGPELWLVGPGGQAWPPERVAGRTYLFIVGAPWTSGEYRVRLKQGEKIEEEPIFRVPVNNPWKREFDLPAIAQPLEANFAGQLKLLGYDLPKRQVKPGESLPLTLYWQALEQAPQADFIQFNHLLDSAGTLHGGYDRLPLEDYSTLLWAPGEVVIDGYTIPVAAEAPPGQYYLNVGYYFVLKESLVYLPLMVDGQMTGPTSVSIGPIEVVAP